MSTPVELVDYQHQLGPVLIGRGTTVDIRDIEGLGQVAPRTADVEPPGEDGLWLGPDYYGGRTLRIDAAVKDAGDSGAVLDTLALLQDASDTAAVRGQAGTTLALRLKFPGRPTRVVHGRLRKFEPGMETLKHGYVPVDLEFQTADHVYYADESASTSMPLGNLTEGGMTFPLVFPFTIAGDPSAVGRPGYLEVVGNRETWPILRVSGPCANPTITHVTTGRQLAVQTTLADGEWVEIDTRPGWRSVLRENGGGAPLSPTSRIDQFALTPGTNEIRWNATDLTLTSTLAVTWWPAYKAL
jgi:hypothetical protein